MRGAKPKLRNVIPMRADGAKTAGEIREAGIKRAINSAMPANLSPELRTEFKRVASILAAPSLDRFKPHYVDTILEYCRANVRLRALRDELPTLKHEVYRVKTRNGDQVKAHPYVAQINETWRQWRSLVSMLGLSPTDERNMLPGQGDFFDEVAEIYG